MTCNLSLKLVSGRKILWRQDGEELVLPRNICGCWEPAVLSLDCHSQGQWSAAPSHCWSWAAHSSILCSHHGSYCQLHFSPASALLPHSPAFNCPAGPDPIPIVLSSHAPSLGLILFLIQENPALLLSRSKCSEWPSTSGSTKQECRAQFQESCWDKGSCYSFWGLYTGVHPQHTSTSHHQDRGICLSPSCPCGCKFHPAHLAVWKLLWPLMAAVPAEVLQEAWDQAETFTQELVLVLDTTCLQKVELVWLL